MADVMLVMGGLVMFVAGLLGPMMMRTYFEGADRRIYAVCEIRSRASQKAAEGGRSERYSWNLSMLTFKISWIF